MSRLIILIAFFTALVGLNNTFAVIYKWLDAEGNSRFSDVPPDSREARNVQEINISNANKMDSPGKKVLVEKVENKAIETELEQRTQDYKKVKNRREDEDASEFLKSLKADKTSGSATNSSNTTPDPNNKTLDKDSNNTPDTSDTTSTTETNSNSPELNNNDATSPNSKLESNLEPSTKLTTAKQNKLIKQAKNCTIAKANLQKLSQSDIILSKNNKLQKMTEEQLGLKIKETKANIAFYC